MKSYKFFKKNINKIYFYLLIPPFIYILIYNLLYYDPILGYDAEAHYSYIDSLSRYLPRRFRIPNASETREFFNPPLAYVFPSFVQVICRNFSKAENLLISCKPVYGKFSQIFQTLMFIFSTYINLLTLKHLTNKNKEFYIVSYMLLVLLLAVNYRTISMIRGEPYILFFLSILIYKFVKLENNNFCFARLDFLKFGILIGGLALSRQWAFLLFPPLFLVTIFIDKESRKGYFINIFKSFFIGFLISGWFYINNYLKYGSLIAFNIDRTKINYFLEIKKIFSLENILEYLFTNPIRPNFNNQFFPILYSDTWGDYWGYFVFTSRYLEVGYNQLVVGQYLGRVNILSSFTTLIMLFGFIYKNSSNKNPITISLLKIFVLFSFLGYLWFVISFPTTTGDTIKATYTVQMLNVLIILGSILIENVKNKKIYFIVIVVLTFICIHNFSSFLSKFPLGFPNLITN